MNAKQKPFEIIFYVGRVTSLQSWVVKKSCHGQTLINECSISDYPSTDVNVVIEVSGEKLVSMFSEIYCVYRKLASLN